MKVLLVDDVAEMRLLLRTVLSNRLGAEIAAEAPDGQRAVALASEHQPDVVVLDLGLPDLEGREVLTGIRNHAPGARVVVFSGTRIPSQEWIAERVEAFVSKEQDLEILLEALESAAQHPVEVKITALPRTVESVAHARDVTKRTLTGWGLERIVPDCLVVVSELVTNAVVHAGTRCELRLSNHRRSVRVAVVDHGPGTPEPQAPDGVRIGGRGLQIVSAMSTAWGVDGLTDGRKLVWAELPRP